MRLDTRILSLPASIILLVISQGSAIQIGRDELSLTQRGGSKAIEGLQRDRNLVGVMKMSLDEGEKFYMEYWQFEQGVEERSKRKVPLQRRDEEAEVGLLANISMPFRPPLALHTEYESSYEDLKARKVLEGRNAAAAMAILEKREFVCPTGYASCSAVGYPNSCCSTSETCFVIQDTGLGPVGCCPNGNTCGGTITSCSASNTACADELGGGCCIPNYVCAGVGCVATSTVITTTITQIFTVSIVSSSTHLTTVVTVSTSTSSSISTPTSTSVIPATSTTTTTSRSLSGSTTATGVAPLRPTGVTSSDSTTAASDTSCPVGFYGCSAYYQGGCCRTGRNCDTTSCPVISSTTILSSGVTIVVPIGSAATVASPTGTCATGWSSCAASVGGNCCPSGWECGTASCSSSGPSSTAVEQKASPNAGSRRRVVGIFDGLLRASCLVMILM